MLFLNQIRSHCNPISYKCYFVALGTYHFSFLQDPAYIEVLANYITELSLLEYNLLCHPPSQIAASAIFLAKYILYPTKYPWVSGFIMLPFAYRYICCSSQNIKHLDGLTENPHCNLEAEPHPYSLHTVQAIRIVRVCKGNAPRFQYQSYE